jgi:hypothetical protein
MTAVSATIDMGVGVRWFCVMPTQGLGTRREHNHSKTDIQS